MVGPVQHHEPLLAENPDRFCMFPIKYSAVWEMYKKAEASFWTGGCRNGLSDVGSPVVMAATRTAILRYGVRILRNYSIGRPCYSAKTECSVNWE